MTKDTFIIRVPDRSEEKLLILFYQWIAPGTIENPLIVMNNKWRSYKNIDKDARYETYEVNHKHNFVDPFYDTLTQHIERVWKALKEGNKRRMGMHRGFIESYFAEHIWRQSLNGRDLTEVIFQDIAGLYETNYSI